LGYATVTGEYYSDTICVDVDMCTTTFEFFGMDK